METNELVVPDAVLQARRSMELARIWIADGRQIVAFHSIISETAYAGSDFSRSLRTTTTYNQEFPLAGKVVGVTAQAASAGPTPNGTTVHTETDNR